MIVLVLSRKTNESIMLGDEIEIVVLAVEGETVRIGIKAPKHVDIYRKEVYDTIRKSNKEAAAHPIDMNSLSEIWRKQK